MKKRIISLLLAVMMLAGMMSVSAFAADTYGTKGVISLSADKTEVYVGDTVTVTVAIPSNPGLAGLELVLKADGLTIGEIKQLDFAGNWETGANGVVWAFEDAGENTTATGNFAEVTFTAAAEGTYTIGVEKAEGGIIDEGTEKYVAFEDVAPLTIKVEKRPYTLGDVVVDGSFDILDVQKACMVFLGVETFECAPEAADVVVDGTFDIMDVQKFCMVFLGVESF